MTSCCDWSKFVTTRLNLATTALKLNKRLFQLCNQQLIRQQIQLIIHRFHKHQRNLSPRVLRLLERIRSFFYFFLFFSNPYPIFLLYLSSLSNVSGCTFFLFFLAITVSSSTIDLHTPFPFRVLFLRYHWSPSLNSHHFLIQLTLTSCLRREQLALDCSSFYDIVFIRSLNKAFGWAYEMLADSKRTSIIATKTGTKKIISRI